jgi:hypothetical protein
MLALIVANDWTTGFGSLTPSSLFLASQKAKRSGIQYSYVALSLTHTRTHIHTTTTISHTHNVALTHLRFVVISIVFTVKVVPDGPTSVAPHPLRLSACHP